MRIEGFFRSVSLVVLSVCFVSFSPVFARGGAYDDYYGHRYGMGYGAGCFDDAEYMRETLNLSSKQIQKIKEIDSDFRDKFYKNRDNYDRIETLRIEHRRAILKVLTPAQRKKYSSAYRQRWFGHRGRGHMGYYYGHHFGMGYGAGCFDNLDALSKDLGLTSAQQEKILKIDSEFRKKYYDNRGDYEKIQSLRMEHRKAIEDVLSADQKKRFNQYYNNRWRGPGHMRGY